MMKIDEREFTAIQLVSIYRTHIAKVEAALAGACKELSQWTCPTEDRVWCLEDMPLEDRPCSTCWRAELMDKAREDLAGENAAKEADDE